MWQCVVAHSLLQKVLNMKLSSRKLQFWEWETLLVLEHLVNRPCWYFTFLHAKNVRDGLMFYIFCSIIQLIVA
jgi:hypothetical protein